MYDNSLEYDDSAFYALTHFYLNQKVRTCIHIVNDIKIHKMHNACRETLNELECFSERERKFISMKSSLMMTFISPYFHFVFILLLSSLHSFASCHHSFIESTLYFHFALIKFFFMKEKICIKYLLNHIEITTTCFSSSPAFFFSRKIVISVCLCFSTFCCYH